MICFIIFLKGVFLNRLFLLFLNLICLPENEPEFQKPDFRFIRHFIMLLILVSVSSSFSATSIKLTNNSITASKKYNSSSQFSNYLKEQLHAVKSQMTIPALDQADLFYLKRYWNNLEKSVQQQYDTLQMIPDSYKVYISPGGNFEVYYSPDPVNSVLNSDNYHYRTSAGAGTQIYVPNGVPDYVDEIAWALDSSWTQDIDKFNFIRPRPYTDLKHTSSRYKVFTYSSNDREYGSTYPFPSDDPDSSAGTWNSIISISTNWNLLGYITNPEDAIRVTCAHEFFHAIQIGMMWDVSASFDNFPVSWLEGNATSMEEITFPRVNDYHLYTSAYFRQPDTPFFSDYVSDDMKYANSLLCLYMYSRSGLQQGISFVRTVMFNNYNQHTPFHQNIRMTSESSGFQWASLLNNFHASSFFSGQYADTSIFINDASSFDTVNYRISLTSNDIPILKTIMPYGLGIFPYESESAPGDSLHITLKHSESNENGITKPWSATVINCKSSENKIIPVSLDNNGDGTIDIPGIKTQDRVLVFVTNGQPALSKKYSVAFNNCNVTHNVNESFSNTVTASDSTCKVIFSVNAKKRLRCDETLVETVQTNASDRAKSSGLFPVTRLFSLSVPQSWFSSAELSLEFVMKNYKDKVNSSPYYWNDSSLSWIKCNVSKIYSVNDTVFASISNPESGIYSFFRKISGNSISLYPNPVSLRNGTLTIGGAILDKICIYTSSGALVYNYKVPENIISTKWELKNTSARKIMPGFYVANIQYRDLANSDLKTTSKRIMVTP